MIHGVYRRPRTPATTLRAVVPQGRNAVPERGRELGFRPRAYRGVVPGRGKDRRVVRVGPEPGRRTADRVRDEQVDALVGELGPPRGFDVVGLGREPDDDLSGPARGGDLAQDVGGRLEDELGDPL